MSNVGLHPFETVNHVGEPVVAVVDAVFEDEEAQGGEAVGEVDGDDAGRRDVVNMKSCVENSQNLLSSGSEVPSIVGGVGSGASCKAWYSEYLGSI